MRRSHSVQKRWLVKRRQLVVLEATTYTRIYGQQRLGKCWCVARSQPTHKNFRCKIIFVEKIFVHFLRLKIFLQRKKANYGIFLHMSLRCRCHLNSKKHNSMQKLWSIRPFCSYSSNCSENNTRSSRTFSFTIFCK